MIKKIAAQVRICLWLASALLIGACATDPQLPDEDVVGIEPPVETPLPDLDPWLEQPVLTRAAQLLDSGDTALAASILRQLDRGKLTPDELALYSILSARALYRAGASDEALNITSQALIGSEVLQPQIRQRLQAQQLEILTHSGLGMQAARQASGWLADATESHRQLLLTITWQQLQQLPLQQLAQERELSVEQDWLGWLDLAILAAAVDSAPQVQADAYLNWLETYPQHPFASEQTAGLDTLTALAETTPQRVALIVPLSGPLARAGQAVLDGYMAAMHQSRTQQWPASELVVLDSSSYNTALEAYRAAVSRGAEVVIGPLERDRLPVQAPDAELPVPWLALNWLPQPAAGFSGFYQLALSPEDESAQLAELAWSDGARSALLVHPTGPWGDSVAAALQQRWEELHGELRGSANYADSGEYSSSIKTALNIAESERRAQRVRQLMSTEIEFTPRRRQDVDVVFLLSGKPQEARSIKPLIAFHYAADLPVYSTSHVYSGQPEPQRDRDLNGTRMVEIPWLLKPDPVRGSIEAQAGNQSLAAMYALGNDAFLLHWRLAAMADDANTGIRGNSGLLTMRADGKIHRRLVPATFHNGTPRAREP